MDPIASLICARMRWARWSDPLCMQTLYGRSFKARRMQNFKAHSELHLQMVARKHGVR
jgi:hypothetical protein